MQPHEIKIRCSSLGYIMTEPKKGSKGLSETCKGHLADIMVRAKYGRQTDISNRYTIKGNMVEEDGITLYSRVTKRFFKKNDAQLENEYITGTPDMFTGSDVHHADTVIDIKSSWDIFTFFRQHEAKLNSSYYWQLMGYMWLTGATKSTLAYCLIDTPRALVYDEARRLYYKMNVLSEDDPTYIAACEELEKNMTYSDIPLKERLIEIEIHRDNEAIERIEQRVEECRLYMASKYPGLFGSVILATPIDPQTTLITG